MKYLIYIIAFILIQSSLVAQINTTSGEINTQEIEVYLVSFNSKTDSHLISIDIGSNIFPIVLENGAEVNIQSPVQLKIYMASKGYSYTKSELYVTRIPEENFFTVRYFNKTK